MKPVDPIQIMESDTLAEWTENMFILRQQGHTLVLMDDVIRTCVGYVDTDSTPKVQYILLVTSLVATRDTWTKELADKYNMPADKLFNYLKKPDSRQALVKVKPKTSAGKWRIDDRGMLYWKLR